LGRLPLLQEFLKAKGLRRWASLTPLCPCGRRYRPQTTTPYPPLPKVIGVSSRVSPFLIPTLLSIPWEASRVHGLGLKRDGLDGVFLDAPSALCGFPAFHRVRRFTYVALVERVPFSTLALLLDLSIPLSVGWLTFYARYVRVFFSRRAIHTSGDSPCRLLAKRYLLGTCLRLIAPFRSMLLTLRGGPQCLAPRARWVPVYPKVFPHS